MALASDADIQVHLPKDKLDLSDVPDSVVEAQLDAERLIKGYLSTTFSATTLAGWVDPGTTPEYIRSIAGRLVASLIYSLRLAQDYPSDSDYAQNKYNAAMSMLELVRTGQVALPEVTEVVDTGGHLSPGHFFVDEDPVFTKDLQF